MSDSWLRAEPLWFGVHLVPEHGILPETKKQSRSAGAKATRTNGAADGAAAEVTAAGDGVDGGDDYDSGRKRRRSVSAERRRKALERRKKGSSDH